jgi:hypothetical protein
MKLVVTIDVEEEGLFNGTYAADRVTASNVVGLGRLDSLFRNLGIRPTLLVSYQAAEDQAHSDLIAELAERWEGEIGAHLHHWNTPPVVPLPHPDPVPSELIPEEILAAKLDNLLDRLRGMGATPVSFRMGRFNLGPKMLGIISSRGISVDSSIAPMRSYYGGPAHLAAPTDPYFPDPENPCKPGESEILEVPITIVPILPKLGNLLEGIESAAYLPRKATSWFAMNMGSLPAQPFLTGLNRLKAAVRLHRLRGGRVVTIFFHSSELVRGFSPQNKTEADVDRFLLKLERYLSWLVTEMHVEPQTLAGLANGFREATAGRTSISGRCPVSHGEPANLRQ